MISIDSEKLHIMLSASRRPVIVTHMKPDGDAIGSSMGMYHTLKSLGKNARTALVNPAPANLDFLVTGEHARDIYVHETMKTETEKVIEESDLIICLDFNAFHRTDTLEDILGKAGQPKILIDHHLGPEAEKFDLVISQPEISSTCELLYYVLLTLPQFDGDARRLPPAAAEALMTGMTTDTNNFANSVYPSTFAMASSLIEAGVDRDRIISMLYNRFKESRIRLQGYVLKELMHITEDGVAYIVLDKETMIKYNVEEGDTEGFVNIPLTIDGIRLSVFAKEDNGYARISIRSKKGTSADMCSRAHFHGGGHENAAGGRLYFKKDIADITEAAEYIEEHTHLFIRNEQN